MHFWTIFFPRLVRVFFFCLFAFGGLWVSVGLPTSVACLSCAIFLCIFEWHIRVYLSLCRRRSRATLEPPCFYLFALEWTTSVHRCVGFVLMRLLCGFFFSDSFLVGLTCMSLCRRRSRDTLVFLRLVCIVIISVYLSGAHACGVSSTTWFSGRSCVRCEVCPPKLIVRWVVGGLV